MNDVSVRMFSEKETVGLADQRYNQLSVNLAVELPTVVYANLLKEKALHLLNAKDGITKIATLREDPTTAKFQVAAKPPKSPYTVTFNMDSPAIK